MSFLSKIFGDSKLSLEDGLEELYVEQISILSGWNHNKARKEVKKAIKALKEEAKNEGAHNLPDNLGDVIIRAAEEGDLNCKKIVDKARSDGATYEDIKEWWNMPDLQRRMVIWSENIFRYAVYLSAVKDERLSADHAMQRVRKMFPIYGDPEDTKNTSGDDRPLSKEIRGRVDKYRQLKGAAYIKEQVASYNTYNAFVREQIRKGII